MMGIQCIYRDVRRVSAYATASSKHSLPPNETLYLFFFFFIHVFTMSSKNPNQTVQMPRRTLVFADLCEIYVLIVIVYEL